LTEFEQKLQTALRAYLYEIPRRRPVAVSLTLRQQIKQQSIDLYEASKNFRHFMNRLNRKAFGNAACRFGKGLRVIPVLEHDELVRYHHHATIDQPSHLPFEEFKGAIEKCWLKTAWGYDQTHIVPVTNGPGWHRYITKADQKPEFDLAIDWMNARTR
jgi:hypothetical protein